MGFFTKAEEVIRKVEHVIEDDVHAVFAKARQDALDANAEVTRLKAALQDALVKARDLHQEAVNAATRAAEKAEQDAQQLRAAVTAHMADAKTQGSQVTVAPAPVSTDTPTAQ
jgi:hypothetical protein